MKTAAAGQARRPPAAWRSTPHVGTDDRAHAVERRAAKRWGYRSPQTDTAPVNEVKVSPPARVAPPMT